MPGAELQREVRELIAKYGSSDTDISIATLGLCGEAGEVANDVKKYRYGKFDFDELRERSKSELKDCLWFMVALAETLSIDFQELLDGTPEHIEKKLIAAQPWIKKKAGNNVEVLRYQ